MKQAQLIFLLLTIFSACKKSENTEVKAPHSIELSTTDGSATAITIKADGTEEVNLTYIVRDIDGKELPLEATIKVNNVKSAGGDIFKTTVAGEYVFQAHVGQLASNILVVTATEILDRRPYKIELSVDKPLIRGDNADLATLKAEVVNKDGIVLSEKSSLTINGSPFEGTMFKTAVIGKYSFRANLGDLVSNEIVVEVALNLSGRPYKIILDSDRYLGLIKANNKDVANFKVSVLDVDGKSLNKPYTLTINGSEVVSPVFKTDQPGAYEFQASIGILKSNIYTITAEEIADSYVEIQSGEITNMTEENHVTATIKYKNTSSSRLKYITFEVSCYNKANELIKEQTRGSTTTSCQATGFFEAGTADSSSFQIGNFPGATHLKVILRSVTLEDGTVITAGQ